MIYVKWPGAVIACNEKAMYDVVQRGDVGMVQRRSRLWHGTRACRVATHPVPRENTL